MLSQLLSSLQDVTPSSIDDGSRQGPSETASSSTTPSPERASRSEASRSEALLHLLRPLPAKPSYAHALHSSQVAAQSQQLTQENIHAALLILYPTISMLERIQYAALNLQDEVSMRQEIKDNARMVVTLLEKIHIQNQIVGQSLSLLEGQASQGTGKSTSGFSRQTTAEQATGTTPSFSRQESSDPFTGSGASESTDSKQSTEDRAVSAFSSRAGSLLETTGPEEDASCRPSAAVESTSSALGLRCLVKNTFLDINQVEPHEPQRKARSVSPRAQPGILMRIGGKGRTTWNYNQ
jgi:hypothetical protein